MEAFLDPHSISLWLVHYGSVALFVLLAFGIIALPVPEETLLVVAGILMGHHKLHILPTLIAAYSGSMCGITVSYLVGKSAGHYLLLRYGSWVGLTQDKLDHVHLWFRRYGTWTLFFGYFVPGVRHFTGLCAGMAALEYPRFASFAYAGAIVWASTFMSAGYFFHRYWLSLLHRLEAVPFDLIATLAILIVALWIVRALARHHNPAG